MFGIGEGELLIIVVFAFLMFGPDKLPGMGRTIGRMLRQFREAQEGFTSVVQSEVMNPLQEAMEDPSSKEAKAKAEARAQALAADADADAVDGSQRETFAERRERLRREREAEAAEAMAAQSEASETEAADEAEAEAAPEKKISAADLYNLNSSAADSTREEN